MTCKLDYLMQSALVGRELFATFIKLVQKIFPKFCPASAHLWPGNSVRIVWRFDSIVRPDNILHFPHLVCCLNTAQWTLTYRGPIR